MLLDFQFLGNSSQRGTVTDTIFTSDTNLLSSFRPIVVVSKEKLLEENKKYRKMFSGFQSFVVQKSRVEISAMMIQYQIGS